MSRASKITPSSFSAPADYAIAGATVEVAFLLRYAMVQGLGLELPTFLTFYPAVFFIAILTGLWPSLLAIVLIAMGAAYWILPPDGFKISKPSDIVSLAFFTVMGVFMSLLAEKYRRNKQTVETLETEKALWESNNKLEAALASMTDAIYISDADGQFIHINDAFIKFHRFKDKAECPKSLSATREFLDMFTANGNPVPLEKRPGPSALRGEKATNVEYTYRRKDTGETWIGGCSFGPLRDRDGSIFGAVVVSRDITEIKAAAQKLYDRERELTLIYQNMHDILFDMAVEPGDQFRFISVNQAFLSVTGLKKEHIEGKLAQEVIPEASFAKALEHYKEAVLTKKTVSWHEISVYPTGVKHADVFVSPVFNAANKCTNLIGVVHDLTEKKKTEKHIWQLNRIYAMLSDTNQTIVREKDIQKILEAACRIAVEKGKFRMAWVGMEDPGTHLLKPVASCGIIDGYLEQVKIDLQNPSGKAGPAARCFHSGEHSICNDIEYELYRPWKSFALNLGYQSLAAFPIKHQGRAVGVFNLYASEVGFFDDEEVKLLDEMAMDISFAYELNQK